MKLDTGEHGKCCPNHRRLLLHLYGPRLKTLREHVEELVHIGDDESSQSAKWPTDGLVRANDCVEYVTLLEKSYAVMAENAGRVTGVSLEQRWSQRQVVERVIQLQLRQEGASRNVLCFGYGQVRSTRSRGLHFFPQGVNSEYRNVAAAFVSTHLWATLLSRIGEEAMLYLLSHATIFVPLPHHCLLQVAGHAVSMVAFDSKQAVCTSWPKQQQVSVVEQGADLIFQNEEMAGLVVNMMKDKDVLHVSGGIPTSAKRVRPSSWLRRREQAKQKRQNISSSSCTIELPSNIAHARGGATVSDELCDRGATDHHIQNALKANGSRDCGTNKRGASKGGHCFGPSHRFINRSRIFYNSSFSCHAGLPANHILNTIDAGDAGIAQLFVAIFGSLDRSGFTSEGILASTLGKDKEKIMKGLRALLAKMVRNARHCNFAQLLSRHCPLPSHLDRSASKKGPRSHSKSKPKKKRKSGSKAREAMGEGYVTQEMDVELQSSQVTDEKISWFQKEPFVKESTIQPGTMTPQSLVQKNQDSLDKRVATGRYSKFGRGHRRNQGDTLYSESRRLPKCPAIDKSSGEINAGDEDLRPTAVLTKLVECSTNHKEVVAFLWAVCRHVLPEELCGTSCFQRKLCSSISSFVSLRRYETFSVQHILNKLQRSTWSWPNYDCKTNKTRNIFSREPSASVNHVHTDKVPSTPQYCSLQQIMLQDWLHWLFSGLIVPLIRTHFYATETENNRQNVLYFRKPVWAKIQLLSMRDLVSNCYQKLDPCTVAAMLQKRYMGFSQIRMLPKQNGVRPIGNLSSGSKCTIPSSVGVQNACTGRKEYPLEAGMRQFQFSFMAINSVLKGAHVCLKYEQERHPEDLGASVFGYKDTYIKLLPFIVHLKGASGGLPPIFMAVCDISKAYDTIKQDKLLEILYAFVRLPIYYVLRYIAIFHTMGAVRISYRRMCKHSNEPHKLLDTFVDLTARRSHCILQDQGTVTELRREQILALLEEHILRNIVRIGSQFYLQKSGIPQGSVLSPLLCSVFFGHVDRQFFDPLLQQPATAEALDKELLEVDPQQVLPSLQSGKRRIAKPLPLQSTPAMSKATSLSSGGNGSILLRLIDDSLFISTSQADVARFVQIMHQGFEDYGCHANRHKTTVSFNLQLGKDQENFSRNIYMSEDGASFMAWSGLLINCCTLEIQADYTRYVGEPIKGSLTVVRRTNPGSQIPIKLCHFLRAKCHPLLYDQRINSPSTVRLNAYQAFVLCGMKFHAYLCSMPHTSHHHPPFLFQAIIGASSYMYGLLRKQMQEMEASVHFGMAKDEMKWLAVYAFQKVLCRKQSRYSELLVLMKNELDKLKYRSFGYCPHLSSAIDEKRSSMFKQIIY